MTEFQEVRTFTIECPNPDCSDPTDVKRGGMENGKQMYRCNTCDKGFAADGSAMRRQFTTKQIGAALDKYYSGMSYKQIAEHLEDFYDVPEPSKHSVHDWIKGYTIMAKRFMDGEVGPDGQEGTASGKPIEAKAGDHWVADELFVRVGGQERYLWNVMDKDSRYVLAAHLSAHRNTNDAIAVMEKALAAAEKPPKRITTDGLRSYIDAIRAVFPRGTEHVVSESIRSEVNNNLSERLQGTFRSRTKTQRGLQSIRTGQDYVDGYVIDYNFFKRHEALNGGVPAEATGVSKQVPWGDSWEDIAKMGGEVAESQNIIVEPVKRKPGPKAKPKAGSEPLRGAAEEYALAAQAKRQTNAAKTRYRTKDKTPVASYPPKHRKLGNSRGRGRIKL